MVEYQNFTVSKLKEHLKEKGLALDGKKSVLIERLIAWNKDDQNKLESKDSTEEKKQIEEVQLPTSVDQLNPEIIKQEENKTYSLDDKKALAIEFLKKKIKRAEKFGDKNSLIASKKDLVRVEKFGISLDSVLSKEIGMFEKSMDKQILHKTNMNGNKYRMNNKYKRHPRKFLSKR